MWLVPVTSKEWRRNDPDRDRTIERVSKRRDQQRRTSVWAQRVRLEGDRRKHLSVGYLQSLQDDNPRRQCCNVEMDFSTAISERKATLGKVVPTLGYRPGNVAIICADCNRKKQNCTLEELRRIGAYVERYAPAGDTADALTAE